MAGLKKPSIKKPKAVIFDWDNTLVNTWPFIHNALRQTFEKHGLTPWTLEETKEKVAHSLRDSFPALFGERWEEAGKDYHYFYHQHSLDDLEILPLSEDVLKFLKEQGVYLAVVSNKKGPSLRAEAEHLGWAKYFDKLVGASDAERDKPYADPVHMALEGSGIQPGEDVWLIGDTVVDLECAKNSECIPVLYGKVEIEAVPSGAIRYKGFDVKHHAPGHQDILELFRRVYK